MYIRDHERTPDAERLLTDLGAGTLVSIDPESMRPHATFLPWAYASDRLTSHIGVINPQATHNGQVLVILMGDDAYISEEWMVHGAPTWDYETVHIYGELIIHTDPDWIIQSFDDLLQRFSTKRIGDYEDSWLESQVRAVVGVEVAITEIQAKSKLSQNRGNHEVRTISDSLEPTCPHLAERIREVSLPHTAAREALVAQARSRVSETRLTHE